jgi:hypothetical protein
MTLLGQPDSALFDMEHRLDETLVFCTVGVTPPRLSGDSGHKVKRYLQWPFMGREGKRVTVGSGPYAGRGRGVFKIHNVQL